MAYGSSYRRRETEEGRPRDGSTTSSPGRRRRRRDIDSDAYHVSGGRETEKRTRRGAREDEEACQSIIITNLPKNVKLYELEALFAPVPGTMAIALMNSKYGGLVGADEDTPVQAAFLLMTGIDTATALMQSDWKHSAYCRDKKMSLAFAEYGLECSMKARVAPTRVWICSSCRCDNAPKRHVCFSCGMLRNIGCDLVDPSVPTKSLRITNIDGDAPEGDLEARIKSITGVHSIRFLRDKVTGRHKGSAYCNCFSIDDAILIRESLHDSEFGQHGQMLQVEFCLEKVRTMGGQKEKQSPRGDRTAWEPAEFQHTPPTIASENLAKPDSEFVYESGYMKEVSSGLYYDVHSGYYFDPMTQAWGTKDPVTNAFVPYADDGNTGVDKPVTSDPQPSRPKHGTVIGAAPHIVHNEEPTPSHDNKVKGIIHTGTWAKKKRQQ